VYGVASGDIYINRIYTSQVDSQIYSEPRDIFIANVTETQEPQGVIGVVSLN
jgi:hypothetical protein